MRRLAAVLWLMEVSTREVEDIFATLGVSINRMTVWREGQKLLEELSHQKLLNPENRFRHQPDEWNKRQRQREPFE